MKKIKLLKPFKIVLDGDIYPKQFMEGDIIILDDKTASDLICIKVATEISDNIKIKEEKVMNADYEKKIIDHTTEKKRRGRPRSK
jgi:hypothetical protein